MMRAGRRILRFRLQSLLVAVFICCIVLAVLSWQRQRHLRQMEAVAAIREAGGLVEIEPSPLRKSLTWAGEDFQGTFDRVTKVDLTQWGGNQWNGPVTTLVPEHKQSISPLAIFERTTKAQQVTDDQLACLGALADLESLNLHGASVTDAGLVHLTELKNLHTLTLHGRSITDEGLAHLKSMESLTSLGLAGTAITDDGLKHLVALPNLRYLNLDSTQISDRAIRHLRQMPQLEVLLLRRTKIAGRPQISWGGLHKLTELDLSCTDVDNDGLSVIVEADSLVTLRLIQTKVGNDGLAHLAGLSRLRLLDLSGQRISEPGCAHLAKMSALEELHLNDTQVNDAGLRQLAVLANLRELSLNDSRMNYHLDVTTTAVAALAAQNSKLTVNWNGPQRFSGYTKSYSR